jgi:hypothetical protein
MGLEIPDEVVQVLGKNQASPGDHHHKRARGRAGSPSARRSLLGLLGTPTATAVLHFMHPIMTKVTSLTEVDVSGSDRQRELLRSC